MASGVSLRILSNDLGVLAGGMAARARQVRLRTALDVEADWKAGVRVDTGTLRRSIHVDEQTATSVSVGTDVAYAPFEEYGTRTMAGSFARTKAMDKNRAPFLAAMRGVVGR